MQWVFLSSHKGLAERWADRWVGVTGEVSFTLSEEPVFLGPGCLLYVARTLPRGPRSTARTFS